MNVQLISYKELEKISAEMDEYIDNNHPNLEQYCNSQHNKICKTPFLTAQLYYVIGTGYSAVNSAKVQKDWYSNSIGNAVYFLRKALAELKENKEEYHTVEIGDKRQLLSFSELYSRININLGNYLTQQYRNIEALEFYDRSISAGNAFGLVTKARCLIEFNKAVYDENSKFFFSKEIYKLTKESLSPESVTIESDKEQFERLKKRQQSYIEFFEYTYPDYIETDHSDTHKEKFINRKHKIYLDWVGRNKLFLNMTNVVNTKEYAYEDCLSLPSFSSKINPLLLLSEELAYHAHFDELKDTFCYARYTFFSGLQIPENAEHFYNSTYKQVNSFDYAINSIKTNSYKTALRCLYSLLDKIAFFAYKFYKVSPEELPEHKVDIKKIFASKEKPAAWLKNIENPFLSALYFLSRDINDVRRQSTKDNKSNTDDELYLSETTFPAANQINQIRNALEHKSLKIVDSFGYELYQRQSNSKNTLDEAIKKRDRLDNLSNEYSTLNENISEKIRLQSFHLAVSVEHIEEQIFELMKLSRNALIYLALSIQHHESNKPNDDVSLRFEQEVPYK